MDWGNLKDNKCPKCGGRLSMDSFEKEIYCKCGFFIGKVKFEKIINSMYQTKKTFKFNSEEENLSELNNL